MLNHQIRVRPPDPPEKPTVQKVVAPHESTPREPATRQRGRAAVRNPQSAAIAQLERAINDSPQADRQRDLATMVDASPAMVRQRKLDDAIARSPRQTAQRTAAAHRTGQLRREEGSAMPEAADHQAASNSDAPVQRVTGPEIARGALLTLGLTLSLGLPAIYQLLKHGHIYTYLWMVQIIQQKNLQHGLTNLALVAAAVPALDATQILDLGEVHAGATVADLTQIGQSANRTLDERIALANAVPALSGAEVGQLAGVHPGINGAGLIHIAQSANRTLAVRIALANQVPALSALEVDQLAGVHGGIAPPGLVQIGQSANRSLADRIAIAMAVQALTGAEVDQLAGVHGGIDVAGLTLIGLSAARTLADRIAVAANVMALTGLEVCQLAAVHGGIDVAGLVLMGQSVQRTLADRITIATGVIALTGQEVCQLAGVHPGINVPGLVLIGQPAVRPLASRIAAANAYPALAAADIAAIALVPVAADLSNTVIDNLPLVTDVLINAATLLERQAVLANAGLRAVVRTLGNAPVLMSALLGGSHVWRNPVANDFYVYFVTNNGNGMVPNHSTMNCWESVLYAFYLAGRKTAADIRTFYLAVTTSGNPNATIWQLLGFHLGLAQYVANVTMPAAGQVIFYRPMGAARPSHIALSLGGNNAQSLWHSPNAITSVQRILVNDLHIPNDTIYFGNLA